MADLPKYDHGHLAMDDGANDPRLYKHASTATPHPPVTRHAGGPENLLPPAFSHASPPMQHAAAIPHADDPIGAIIDSLDRTAAREAMTPLQRSVEAVTYSIKGDVFGSPSDFNQRVAAGNLTDAQLQAFDKGAQRLTDELAANPAFMRALGAHPAANGKPQSLGALDLDGDGKSLTTDRMALAAAIDERRTRGESIEQIAKELGDNSLVRRAASIMQAIDSATGEPEPAQCKPVPLRIIPCDKGGRS